MALPGGIDNLVCKSSGYLIHASTIIKFIDDKIFCPTERLEVITGAKEEDFGPRPFAALDQLYTQILDQLFAARLLWEGPKVGHIEQLLELDPGGLRLILRGLRSLVNKKKENGSDSSDWSLQSEIVVHHTSFSDFLQDPKRAGKFYISGGPHLPKTWCYRYEDPSANRQGHVSWWFRTSSVFKFIAAVEPSSDLLHLLRHFNPDFWFENLERESAVDSVLAWLKHSDSLLWDKTSGSLRSMLQIFHGEVDKERIYSNLKYFKWYLEGWTNDLKLCPPCPLLLRVLCDLEPYFDDPEDPELWEYHDIVHWLECIYSCSSDISSADFNLNAIIRNFDKRSAHCGLELKPQTIKIAQPAAASQDGRDMVNILRNKGEVRETVEQWTLFLHFLCITKTIWLARRLEAAVRSYRCRFLGSSIAVGNKYLAGCTCGGEGGLPVWSQVETTGSCTIPFRVPGFESVTVWNAAVHRTSRPIDRHGCSGEISWLNLRDADQMRGVQMSKDIDAPGDL
ncbi:hypothetical protein DFH08DRAFT_821602 [Mycena albidolilacea]|uniref:Uncharacterized protein n=1 Tax=Mycena albidolilacea TaxID=1033008 RepID=A0AAD6Z9T7_9AGAR|nr:hypothetical protein DFH08DRAFT_821602 [Mycena albidolilacea]